MPPAVSSDDESEFSDARPVLEQIATKLTPKRKAAHAPKPEIAELSTDQDDDGDDARAALNKDVGEDDNEEDDDDDDDEGDEEEYVVEKILKHAVSDSGALIYEVKWKNFTHADNTWEPEEHLDGAVDILKAYFKKIGGRPVDENNPKDMERKRSRKSASTADVSDAPSKRMKTEVPVRKGRPSRGGTKTEDTDEKLNWPTTSQSGWEPPKVAKDSWEDHIMSLEAIDQEKGRKKPLLWAYVKWIEQDDEGQPRMSKVMLESVHKAAPQAAIKFYESHLAFVRDNGSK